jgi:hypothetical protein
VTPEQILGYPARVLSDAQRRTYFETGFLAASGLIPDEWLRRLVDLSDAFLEESRRVTASNEAFDLGPEHGPARPHVRRLRALVDRHPDFWRTSPPISSARTSSFTAASSITNGRARARSSNGIRIFRPGRTPTTAR